MPRYYIDMRDEHGLIPDEEGAEFDTLQLALAEAKASAQDIAHQNIRNRRSIDASCVEVRDERGQVVAALTVAEVLAHPRHPEFQNHCPGGPPRLHR